MRTFDELNEGDQALAHIWVDLIVLSMYGWESSIGRENGGDRLSWEYGLEDACRKLEEMLDISTLGPIDMQKPHPFVRRVIIGEDHG